MAQKLVITLDASTTAKYLKLSRKLTEAEVNADCEPSSRRLIIDIAPAHYGGSIVNFLNNNIGNVSINFVDD